MAKRKKRGFHVQVRMTGERKIWSYYLQAVSAGKAVERVLFHTGWLPSAYGDTFVVQVRACEDIPISFSENI
jgi:uncharacterized protein YcnI